MKIEDCKIGMTVGVVETESHNIEVSISKLLGVLE